MSSLDPQPEWSHLIYRVSDDAHQQRILHAFHRIAWPGITVLGSEGGGEHYVIVDCESSNLERHARRIILRVDGGAVRMLRSRPSSAAGAVGELHRIRPRP